MKKRDDIRAQAAARDLINGLNMALVAVGELSGETTQLFSDLEDVHDRADPWLKRRVTAEVYRDATD